MTISHELEARIQRLHEVEKWPVGTIASHLGVHHSVVTRVLECAGLPRASHPRRSKADAYMPFIEETLRKYPKLCASRVYQMCIERGYCGSESHFRRQVARVRPRPKAEAFLRLRTLPGEQAQVDWGHFGKIRIGRAERPLMAFVMTLSYSRRTFLRYFCGQQTEHFLRGHALALAHFGGVPRVVLYDNLKSAVLERRDDVIRFHPRLVEVAQHYRFEARPVAVARGNEKGRVERAIQHIRRSFFAARPYRDLDDLNVQAIEWCDSIAVQRPWPEDRSISVADAVAEEQPRLLPLPTQELSLDERTEVSVGKTPYARFDLNDYSIPHDHAHRMVTVVASADRVRIFDGVEPIAEHERSYSRGEQIENPDHIRKLVAQKRRAREKRGAGRLHDAAPNSRELLAAIAERGENLGAATSRLLRLLDEFGATAVNGAIATALAKGAPHPHAVRQILDQERQSKNQKPSLPVELPDDPRVRDMHVQPHDLGTYDAIDGHQQEVNDES